MKRRLLRCGLSALMLALVTSTIPARAAEDSIKIGYIDPFSGPAAGAGDQFLQVFHYIIDYVNAHEPPLGKKYELVTFDDKMQPAEALIALKQVIDRGMPFVLQCAGSNVAEAMIGGVAKNNERNPDHRVVYLNCGALATELTNEKCNFWHFRFFGSVQQRAYARVKSLPADVKKVYLINPDYLYGHSVQHDTLAFLAKLRPDIQVVGDEFVPLLQVKDFSPYITKIKQSSAQSLVTGNGGSDLNLLIRAGSDAGLSIRYDTYLAWLTGAVKAIGPAGADRLSAPIEYTENLAVDLGNKEAEAFGVGFRKDHKFGFFYTPWITMFQMLSRAINEVGSTDPLKVALKLEGMQAKDLVGNPVLMRKDDHQLIMPLYAATLTKGLKYDVEGTGLGWKVDATFPAEQEAMPTTCKMKRPSEQAH